MGEQRTVFFFFAQAKGCECYVFSCTATLMIFDYSCSVKKNCDVRLL